MDVDDSLIEQLQRIGLRLPPDASGPKFLGLLEAAAGTLAACSAGRRSPDSQYSPPSSGSTDYGRPAVSLSSDWTPARFASIEMSGDVLTDQQRLPVVIEMLRGAGLAVDPDTTVEGFPDALHDAASRLNW